MMIFSILTKINILKSAESMKSFDISEKNKEDAVMKQQDVGGQFECS